MTAPIIIQPQPSFAESLRPSIQQLMALMEKRRADAQRQQQMELQQQQIELQGLSQRSLERERVTNRALQLMDALGPDVLEDPSVQNLLKEGGINPKSIKQRYDQGIQEKQDQMTFFRTTLSNLVPQGMQKGINVFFGALDAGFGQDAATTAMRETFKANPPSKEQISRLAEEWPELFGPNAGIPFENAMEELVKIRAEEASIRVQYGPGWSRKIDTDLAAKRLEIADRQLAKAVRDATGDVLPSQRLRAALEFYNFFRRDLDDNRTAYDMRYGRGTTYGTEKLRWQALSDPEKLQILYGREIAGLWRGLPKMFDELGGLSQYGLSLEDLDLDNENNP